MDTCIFFDRVFEKNGLKGFIFWTFDQYGCERSLELTERLKDIGFRLVTKVGFSLSTEDLLIPKEKRWRVKTTDMQINKDKICKNFRASTFFEVTKKLVSAWVSTNKSLE